MKTKVGDKGVTFSIEVVENDAGYGFYNIDFTYNKLQEILLIYWILYIRRSFCYMKALHYSYIKKDYKLVFINAPGLGGEENYLNNIYE